MTSAALVIDQTGLRAATDVSCPAPLFFVGRNQPASFRAGFPQQQAGKLVSQR